MGITRKGEYQINSQLSPKPSILKWLYTVNGQKLIDLNAPIRQNNILQGNIDFTFLRSFLTQSTKHLILGRDCII